MRDGRAGEEGVQRETKPQKSNLPPHQPWIGIPTGGSSHPIRFAMHSVATLTAAVAGFRQFFTPTLPASGQIHSLCLLPLFHVGGLMQWWRSGLSGGNILFADYSQLKATAVDLTGDFDWLLSLVPTQLKTLMERHPQWLQQFRLIFVGGAPAWPDLLNQARQLHLNLAPTYGMTETAAQIATLLPAEFLAGQTGVGRILPHASVTVEREGMDSAGLLAVQSRSLCWGYYPDRPLSRPWLTGDLGYFQQSYLHILGRQQRQIISGGEKIDPQAIEQLFLSANKVQDIVVLGIPDSYWGEQVIAIYQPLTSRDNASPA